MQSSTLDFQANTTMCGIFGIYSHPEAANLTYLGLHALQHRGQESAGITTSDKTRLYVHRIMGLVQAGFHPSDLARLPGDRAIGHVRYSTAGGSHIRNAQPFAVDYAHGSIAVAHNGNLTNHEVLRERLEARGSIFQSASDTETIVHLIAMSSEDGTVNQIADALKQVEGAYSILFLTETSLIAARDPMGIRPLCMGKLKTNQGEAVLFASEPTSFDLIGAERIRDVEPGEMIVVNESGTHSIFPFKALTRKMCLFEYVYFARPDSNIDNASVYDVRKELGRRLAKEQPLLTQENAVVIPVPDSGVPAAIGFSNQSGVPFEIGLTRSHYIGRTFIEPQQTIRHFGVRLKLNPNKAAISGKCVVVVDDSIVRGTTSRKIVKMIRDAGAKEVHVRISSPPSQWPCFYGIDTPTRAELIAASHTVDEITKYLTADSLGYLSLEGLIDSVRTIENKMGVHRDTSQYCHACFSGQYPIPFSPPNPNRKLRLVNDSGPSQ